MLCMRAVSTPVLDEESLQHQLGKAGFNWLRSHVYLPSFAQDHSGEWSKIQYEPWLPQIFLGKGRKRKEISERDEKERWQLLSNFYFSSPEKP